MRLDDIEQDEQAKRRDVQAGLVREFLEADHARRRGSRFDQAQSLDKHGLAQADRAKLVSRPQFPSEIAGIDLPKSQMRHHQDAGVTRLSAAKNAVMGRHGRLDMGRCDCAETANDRHDLVAEVDHGLQPL
jgi:hypothetical protein